MMRWRVQEQPGPATDFTTEGESDDLQTGLELAQSDANALAARAERACVQSGEHCHGDVKWRQLDGNDVLNHPDAEGDAVVAAPKKLLLARHGSEDFTVMTQEEMLDVPNWVLNVITFAVGILTINERKCTPGKTKNILRLFACCTWMYECRECMTHRRGAFTFDSGRKHGPLLQDSASFLVPMFCVGTLM